MKGLPTKSNSRPLGQLLRPWLTVRRKKSEEGEGIVGGVGIEKVTWMVE